MNHWRRGASWISKQNFAMSAYSASIGEPESSQDTVFRNTTPSRRPRPPPTKSSNAKPKKPKYNICLRHHFHNVEVRLMDVTETEFLVEMMDDTAAVLEDEKASYDELDLLIADQQAQAKAQSLKQVKTERDVLESRADPGGSRPLLAIDAVIDNVLEDPTLTHTKSTCQQYSSAVQCALEQIDIVNGQLESFKAQIQQLHTTKQNEVAAFQASEQQKCEQRLNEMQAAFNEKVEELREEQQKAMEERIRQEKSRYKSKLAAKDKEYDERLKALQTTDITDFLDVHKEAVEAAEARYSKIEDVQADHERYIRTLEERHKKDLTDQLAGFDTQIESHQKYRDLQAKLRVANVDRKNIKERLTRRQRETTVEVNKLKSRLATAESKLATRDSELSINNSSLAISNSALEDTKAKLQQATSQWKGWGKPIDPMAADRSRLGHGCDDTEAIA